jgi:hypothetical protein
VLNWQKCPMQQMNRLNLPFNAQLLSKAGRGRRPCCCVCCRGQPAVVEAGVEAGGAGAWQRRSEASSSDQAQWWASGVEERGVGCSIELQARRMVPAPVDDMEQAAAGADQGERLMAVLCGAAVMVMAARRQISAAWRCLCEIHWVLGFQAGVLCAI